LRTYAALIDLFAGGEVKAKLNPRRPLSGSFPARLFGRKEQTGKFGADVGCYFAWAEQAASLGW
jgi:hypothetical protein